MNKDEKKMIEDMARNLCGRTHKCDECVMPLTPICGYKSYCKTLFNVGYRKVADDEIVIKKGKIDTMIWTIEEVAKKLKHSQQETAREILETVRKVYGNNHGLILWLKTTYEIETED